MGAEQRLGYRKMGSMVPLRIAKGNFDIATRLKALLIRRDVYKHLQGVFPHFEKEVAAFSAVDWYNSASKVDAEDVEEDRPDDMVDDCKIEVSAYASRAPLTKLCLKLAKNHYETALCKIATLS